MDKCRKKSWIKQIYKTRAKRSINFLKFNEIPSFFTCIYALNVDPC